MKRGRKRKGIEMIRQLVFMTMVGIISTPTIADVEVLEFGEKSEWEAAVGSFETIDFTGSEHGEYIGDDYIESHGVTFGNAYYWNTIGFLNDDWGFRNNAFVDPGVWVEFDEPKMWIAADHPGVIQFDLFSNGELIASSNLFVGGGTGNFSGLLSTHAFDRVYLYKPEPFSPVVSADDLHFGPPIPAPTALGVLAIAGLLTLGRRRRAARAGVVVHGT